MRDSLMEKFEKLAPPELMEEANLWKQRQSVATKVALLEAAISCLAELGYARTNQLVISERSGVSRGGLQHHYRSYMDFMASVADYTYFKRLKRACEQIRDVSEEERLETYMEAAWQSMLTTEYEAYLELVAAARTDDELRKMLTPKARRFEKMWAELSYELFPTWQEDTERFELANDLLHMLFDGHRFNTNIWRTKKRAERLKTLSLAAVNAVREGALSSKD